MKIQGQIYLVGGAVRDIAMGRAPKDKDYVVVGGSEENLLRNGFKKVGADFPVFLHPQTNEEYALARTEKKSGVGYNGFDVHTEGVTLEEDLSRRDFTMNAMAMTSSGVIIDPFGGLDDIANQIIRHTTDAFKDDPLRALRAARFAARYGFVIDADTVLAIHKIPTEDLIALPKERIFLEVEKAASDKTLYQFYTILKNAGLDWVFRKVMPIVESDNVNKFSDPDDALTCAILLAYINQYEVPVTSMTVGHRTLAGHIFKLIQFDFTAEGYHDFFRSVGKSNAAIHSTFAILRKFIDIDKAHTFLHLYDEFHDVNAEKVLKETPGLVGPELGAAIKAMRIQKLKESIQ